jgi:acetyltransferase-like isoleucine patch superfamily enzyme
MTHVKQQGRALSWIRGAVRRLAAHDARFERLYRAVCNPDGTDYADLLRERGDFYAVGQHCFIDRQAVIPRGDRSYIRLGNNVRMAKCTLLGHDGSVNMINRAYGLSLDNVGKIDIRDNVYIGHGATILPNVTIGPNAIVCAGSVVRSDVHEGEVVAGVPARPVGRVDVSVQILSARNQRFPWRHLIVARKSEYDPRLEPELVRMRVEHFYGRRTTQQAPRLGRKSNGGAPTIRTRGGSA